MLGLSSLLATMFAGEVIDYLAKHDLVQININKQALLFDDE
ncbi:hypothetical protein [Photorhabdus noenieputensis]|nr:hypothetical protein [Photorhabdus noenieputensis]